MQDLTDHAHRSKAAWEQTGKALKQLDHIRKELDKLGDKQDMVTMDDVVGAAGRLVAHGIDPVALAGVLADAPQDGGGAALGGWVQSHAQAAMEGEQKLLALHQANQHEMGVAALHVIMGHTMGGGKIPIREQPSQPNGGNDLEGGGNQLNGNGASSPAATAHDPIAHGMRFMERQ
jgi:hypothetical protein